MVWKLNDFRFSGKDDGAGQIAKNANACGEQCSYSPNSANSGGVNIHIFRNAAAYAIQHFSLFDFIQSFHTITLCLQLQQRFQQSLQIFFTVKFQFKFAFAFAVDDANASAQMLG